jgi:hypothetical protein
VESGLDPADNITRVCQRLEVVALGRLPRMFRRVITYQLILAVAIGPLVCCCTTTQLLAATAQQPSSRTSHSHSSKARVTSPCCAHKHERSKSKHDRGHSDHKQAPSKPAEKCPCKDGSGKTEQIQAEVTGTDASSVLRTLTSDLVLTFAVGGGTSCPAQLGLGSATSRGPNASLPSTDDLLYSHHNLRC